MSEVSVRFRGMSSAPSDMDNTDGDLAFSFGVINEDGELRPIQRPREMFELQEGESIAHVHQTLKYKHIILQRGANTLRFRDTTTGGTAGVHTFSDEVIIDVKHVGNTLIVLTDKGVNYFLWKEDIGAYRLIGNKPPYVPLSFSLTTLSEVFSIGDLSFYYAKKNPSTDQDKEEHEHDLSEVTRMLAEYNRMVRNAESQNKFTQPFFIRYAIRLYDGSLTRYSPPVLMTPCSGENPFTVAESTELIGRGAHSKKVYKKSDIICLKSDLEYCLKGLQISDLKDWGDIVSSIDIFISAPIYTYDQNTKGVEIQTGHKGVSVSSFQSSRSHRIVDISEARSIDPNNVVFLRNELMDINERVGQEHSFHLVSSVQIDDLPLTRQKIKISKGTLQSLVNREPMTDDYDSNDGLVAKGAFVYNNRLSLTGVSKVLSNSYHPMSSFCFTGTEGAEGEPNHRLSISVFVRQEGREIILRNEGGTCEKDYTPDYFYFPNTKAYKAIFTKTSPTGETKNYVMDLKRHTFLNGAYFFNGWDYSRIGETSYTPQESPLSERMIRQGNKIYTSPSGNPFVFPAQSVNALTSEIIALASATKPLSQGQFGQFPLYAFTKEGIWALSVGEDGSYTSVQPVSRDICIGKESIVSLDSAIVFGSARGLMLLQGGDVTCISEIVNNAPTDLQVFPKLLEIINSQDNLAKISTPLVGMKRYVQGAGIGFDYPRQRIIVFNRSYDYAYVYSLKSNAWGAIPCNYSSAVQAYPDSYAITKDRAVLNLSDLHDMEDAPFVVVSRSIRFGDVDSLKTLRSSTFRGDIWVDDEIKSIVYGSRDLQSWRVVNSSSGHRLVGRGGTPFKYFTYAAFGKLSNTSTLTGLSIDFEVKRRNKIR